MVYSSVKRDNTVDQHAWARLLRDFDEMATGRPLGGAPAAQDGRKVWKLVLLVTKGAIYHFGVKKR